MRTSRVAAITFAAAMTLSTCQPIAGQGRSRQSRAALLEAALTEHAISADQFDDLVGRDVVILLNSGKRVTGGTIRAFGRGRHKAFFRTVSIQKEPDDKPRRYAGGLVFHLEVGDDFYRVMNVPSKRAYALIDETARNRAIIGRLTRNRGRLWPRFSDDEQAEHVRELKQFLERVATHFAALGMQLHETEYFLFLTDMPTAQVAPYLRNLDDMNERLGGAFGFQPGANVWYGKAAVVAFLDRGSFLEFEQHFMDNAVQGNYQGLCHQNSLGRVVVGCYRGDDPNYFASLIVHETSHGYVHRYRSTQRVPSWLNEGIADWIAGVTVPASKGVRDKQERSAERLRQTGTFGGQFFETTQIAPAFYGAASACVGMLVRENSVSFRVFIDGIKEGHTWQESLSRAYGLTPAELAAAYGRGIGVPRLTP